MTLDAPARMHPLQPVLDTVLQASGGAPFITFGGDLEASWYPGTWLTDPDGPTLTGLLTTIADEWGVGPHGAAALAFKGYAWAATMPVVVGWAQHQRVPMLDSDRLRVGIASRLPFVRLDLEFARIGVQAGDPLGGDPDALAVDDLADTMVSSLLSSHLAEVIEALHTATRVGKRLLWGSVAESAAGMMLRLPVPDPARAAREILGRLGDPVTELVDVADGPDGPTLRRRTCCLWFTGTTGRKTYCSTCCVTP